MEKKWQESITKKNSKIKDDLEKNDMNSYLGKLENLIEKEKTKYFDLKPT